MRPLIVLITLLMATMMLSCRKGPGVGGKATITGRVYENKYNSTYSVLLGEYYVGDHDVYIVYGDDRVQSDKVSTHYDGVYEFEYLLPGTYTIYVYSKDKTGTSVSGDIVIEKQVEITDKKEVVTVEDFVIDDN